MSARRFRTVLDFLGQIISGVANPIAATDAANKQYVDAGDAALSLLYLPFPFNGSANKTAAPPGYNSANWFSPELIIPASSGYATAKLQVKCEATSGTAAFSMSVSELNAGSSTPTTSPITASLVSYAAGAGVATLTSGSFAIAAGKSYIVSALRTTGANGMTVYAANLILSP